MDKTTENLACIFSSLALFFRAFLMENFLYGQNDKNSPVLIDTHDSNYNYYLNSDKFIIICLTLHFEYQKLQICFSEPEFGRIY